MHQNLSVKSCTSIHHNHFTLRCFQSISHGTGTLQICAWTTFYKTHEQISSNFIP